MSAHLEQRLADERRHWAALVDVDDGTPDHFEDLCRRSEAKVRPTLPFHPSMDPDSAWCPASGPEVWWLAGDLAAEWLAYRERWTEFTRRNPKVFIASALDAAGETHDYNGWPIGRELRIRDWVRSGFTEVRPFDDRMDIDTNEWRAGLTKASAAAGPGWVYAEGDVLMWKPD